MEQHTIAIVFDFDDTLVPDSTTSLLIKYGVDPENFWKVKQKKLIEDGWDPVHGYIKLLLDLTGRGKPLYGLTNQQLIDFGRTLDPYKGLVSFFSRTRKLVRELVDDYRVSYKRDDIDITVEFYVISGGLEEIVDGCEKISKELTGFWGCRLAADKKGGPVKHIKRTISFTEKTRYLFEIHKGLKPKDTYKNPLLVNSYIPKNERHIPFQNMIYIGDGLTDIPCFSLIENNGGRAFGVLKIGKHGKAKREVFENFSLHKRVTSFHSPQYGKRGDLGLVIQTAVFHRCAEIFLEKKQAL